MYRTNQIRRQDELGKRSRWWRDGLLCGFVAGLAGLVVTWQISLGSLWLIVGAAAVGGLLGAVFGDRVLRLFYV